MTLIPSTGLAGARVDLNIDQDGIDQINTAWRALLDARDDEANGRDPEPVDGLTRLNDGTLLIEVVPPQQVERRGTHGHLAPALTLRLAPADA
jgi:hypothetical protein